MTIALATAHEDLVKAGVALRLALEGADPVAGLLLLPMIARAAELELEVDALREAIRARA